MLMYHYKDILEQIMKVAYTVRHQRGNKDEVLKVASLGYPNLRFTKQEIKTVLGDDFLSRAKYRWDDHA